MTNKKIFSVFAIVAVAAIMGVSSIAPALAERTVKTTDFNETIVLPDFSPNGDCGENGALRVFHINAKTWNNGKIVFHIDIESFLFSFSFGSGLTLVGTSTTVVNFVGDLDDLPVMLQANATVECEDGSTPVNEHFGFTVDPNLGIHPHFPVV
jgi:hypothetical protein